MKKLKITLVLSAILAFAIFLSSCSQLNQLSELAESLGDAVSTFVAALTDDEINNDPASTESPDVVETDENGHITKLYHYDGEGNLVFTHTQTWENDRIINKKSFDKTGAQTASIDYEYDERGNNTVMSWFFWNTGTLMKVERVYDEYDRMIESTGFGTEIVSTNKTYLEYDDKDGEHPKNYYKKTYYPSWPGDRYYVTTFEYNEDGLLSKATTVDKDGAVTSYEIYINENGKAMGYTSFNGEGKAQYTYKYVYDENGKKLREERYDGDGNLVGIDY